MKSFPRLCLLAALLVSLLGAGASAAPKNKKKPVSGSVFFIGNSYTYVNDLPAVVETLLNAGAKGKADYTVDSHTRGAASLAEFLDSPQDAKCREKVEKGGYRRVVLQDQSQTPAEFPEQTMRAGRAWAQIAQKGGAKPVLFITWEHVIKSADGTFASTPRMQDKLTATYCRLAVETGALTAPVGEAWRAWRQEFPETSLYSDDGSHPNPLGTYLAACVFYSALTGNSPIGLPAQVKQGGRLLLRIPAKEAKDCQRVAWKVVRAFDPADFLKEQATREAALPDLADIRPMLTHGVTLKELALRLGKPVSTYKADSRVFRHFLLRDGMELQIICTPDGSPTHATVIRPNAMSEIIKLGR